LLSPLRWCAGIIIENGTLARILAHPIYSPWISMWSTLGIFHRSFLFLGLPLFPQQKAFVNFYYKKGGRQPFVLRGKSPMGRRLAGSSKRFSIRSKWQCKVTLQKNPQEIEERQLNRDLYKHKSPKQTFWLFRLKAELKGELKSGKALCSTKD
jgi:hypothetical protein